VSAEDWVGNCAICGKQMRVKAGKRGRKPTFCSRECRDVEDHFNRLESAFGLLELSETHMRKLRSRTFKLANLLNR